MIPLNPLRRVITVGGGLAAGLLAAGAMAAYDLAKGRKTMRDFPDFRRETIRPKHRRIWLWPS